MTCKLIVSPHLDDAFLAMGGTLLRHKHKQRYDVLTLFNTAWALAPFEKIHYSELTAINLQEEKAVMSILGCNFTFLNLPEALLRGYSNWNENVNYARDEWITMTIRKNIITNIYDEIFFPAAIGNHVDHQLVYSIISTLSSKPVIYVYEDLPYACYDGYEARIRDIQRQFATEEILTDISAYKRIKANYLSIYKSQLDTNTIDMVTHYSENIKSNGYSYERVWKLSKL